jgi:hypothetical protein
MKIKHINKVIDDCLCNNEILIVDSGSKISLDINPSKSKLFKGIEVFTIPDKEIYALFKDVTDLVKEHSKAQGLNFERNYFYIKSKLINDNKQHPHLFAPSFKNTFFGIINLSEQDLLIEGLDQKISLSSGSIEIFSSSDKINILFAENQRALSFNVSSCEFLSLQQPNTWLPII